MKNSKINNQITLTQNNVLRTQFFPFSVHNLKTSKKNFEKYKKQKKIQKHTYV